MKKIIRVIFFFQILLFGFLSSISILEASVVTYQKEVDGVLFILDKGSMKIKICKDDIIEVLYTSLDTLKQKKSLVVINEWNITPNFNVSETSDEIILSTSILRVKINKTTNSITYTTPGGDIILAEDSSNAKRVEPCTVAGINTHSCKTVFMSPFDEALYGLGCHPTDPLSMNYKGRNQDLAIQYMTGAIPVLLSNRGYGLMWDNYSASYFWGGEASNTKYIYASESGTSVDYYFFYGPDFDHIISLYRETTGQAQMFPKWAFGLFQSQDRYQSQSEVLSVKNNYRNNKIPVDCIVQDWFYWTPDLIGSHVMNSGRYPNPGAMIDSLHNANIHAMISIWPVFASGTANYNELKNAGALTSITWQNVMSGEPDTYYDAHDSIGRDIYWRQANDALITRYGWDGWWVDQCEPDNGGDLDARRQATFALGKGIDYFNTYSLMHSTGLYKNWRNDIPNKRAFFLTRQAFAGQQRNAATLWSSDITCSYDAFKIQVPQGINACVSGIPYWTSDIGGYHLNWQAPDWSKPYYRQLFTRWFQFGTFCPIFRIHGKGERALFSKNWDAATKKILLDYDNLRYRLMPYIYSLAWKVTSENYTIMRSLAFDFRSDAAIYTIQDEYMFGPAFLVNPITEQVQSRQVYLPSRTDWYDFWTGEKYSGGQTINALAPIQTIPLYIKAGSIIPMGSFLQYATEKSADTIEVRVYPGADGEFTLYEDDNETYNYEKGQYSTIKLTYKDAQKQLTIGDRIGSFNTMKQNKIFNIVFVNNDHGTGLNYSSKIDLSITYSGTTTTSVLQTLTLPKQFRLYQNYPNPFNPETIIRYTIPSSLNIPSNQEGIQGGAGVFIQLKVYDMLGREVATLVDKEQMPGNYEVKFNGRNLSSGIFFYKLRAGSFSETKKLILLR